MAAGAASGRGRGRSVTPRPAPHTPPSAGSQGVGVAGPGCLSGDPACLSSPPQGSTLIAGSPRAQAGTL